MKVDEHSRSIGALICNLQSIEFQIRTVLAWDNYPKASGMPTGHKLADLTVGDEYATGTFTNYDSLGQLLSAFNTIAERRALKRLPDSLLELRNALAHGRFLADPGDSYFRLIKFSPVKNGRVKVTYNEVLDPDWYSRQRRMLSDVLWILEDACQQH